jgi:hypothetical protein
MVDLRDYFSRCVVISLGRTPQRLASFRKRLSETTWPFREVEVLPAIDGRLCPPAPFFNQGNAAWGAFRSHLRCIEDALRDGVKRLLVLEDDAEFTEGFAAKVAAFLNALPQDAELVYLGGQTNHYKNHPPQVINPEVVRPWSVNRLHAYALTNAGMKKVYRHLTAHNWQTGHHIDHHLERLSRGDSPIGQIVTYAPTHWLVEQAAGYSEILGRHLRRRSFDRQQRVLPMVLAVLGPYRGGTSALAGALHKLGVVMGRKFFEGGKAASPKGCFEAKMLYDLCLACYPEPHFQEAKPFDKRVKLLRVWLQGRGNEGAIIGAKHAKLCLMVPEMLQAWPECKFVVLDRPLEKSIDSLRKLGWWQAGIKPEELIGRLISTRDRDIAAVPAERVLRLDFDKFLAEPRKHLEWMAAFAEIEPSPEQFQQAEAHLDKSLDHHQETDSQVPSQLPPSNEQELPHARTLEDSPPDPRILNELVAWWQARTETALP